MFAMGNIGIDDHGDTPVIIPRYADVMVKRCEQRRSRNAGFNPIAIDGERKVQARNQ